MKWDEGCELAEEVRQIILDGIDEREIEELELFDAEEADGAEEYFRWFLALYRPKYSVLRSGPDTIEFLAHPPDIAAELSYETHEEIGYTGYRNKEQ